MSPHHGLFFELPGSSIRAIPLVTAEGNRLQLGFVEVGCQPKNKRKQLKDKRELFYKYWGDTYRTRYGIDWLPEVYRTLAHYNPEDQAILDAKKFKLDAVIVYSYITQEMLLRLDENDRQEIFRVITTPSKKRDVLEEILAESDAERLHDLILHSRRTPEMALLRGKMAEIFVLKDLEATQPAGMNLFRNGNIRYFNRRYRNGTEIDGIQTFYQVEVYLKQIETLRKLDHLRVRDRWH